MNGYHKLVDQFQNRRPLLNIVLDGYGLGPENHTNAIYQARTPFMDQLRQHYPTTSLLTHGPHVGLPGENDMGGSEVGHLTMGAGRIIAQGPTMINQAIADGSFFESPVLQKALNRAQTGALHLIGLLSDGNVHSHLSHFFAIIDAAAQHNVRRCFIHALLDGRDVGIQTADQYIEETEKRFAAIRQADPDRDYRIASGGGREVVTMDRDQNWDKVAAGWHTHVHGKSGHNFRSALDAVRYFRDQTPGLVDQDCPPFNIEDENGQVVTINDGDAVIFMNFRADRAIELTSAFVETNFSGFDIDHRPEVYFAGMMVYDEDRSIPANVIMRSPVVDRPFGRRLVEMGLRQFRLAETQKYAHVTFFYNGGYRNPLDPNNEIYHLIPSDKIDSFARAPQMKAAEIAAAAVRFVEAGDFDFGLINFANTDMVGHTGDFQATVRAAETVDEAVRKICGAIKAAGGIAVVTADHGNADEMIVINPKTGREEISTKHSINPVSYTIYDPRYNGNYRLQQRTTANPLNLSRLAATNYILLGRPVPDDINPPLFDI
jgi:2,3-bisphosphoglycerate-independent phosphoglycerate mutase